MTPGIKPLRLAERAEKDLRSIWRFSRTRYGERRAADYYNAILDCFSSLQTGALAGQPHQSQRLFRKVRVGQHFIFFQQDERAIYVYRILHQRMNFDQHL